MPTALLRNIQSIRYRLQQDFQSTDITWKKRVSTMENRRISSNVELLRRQTNPLPIPGQRNVLVTSALPYVNNVPHLGNIIGSVLSADVFSRYNKARNRTTLFVSGTDEYGTAAETRALQEGVTPQELCDKYHSLHRQIYDWFDIEFDYFGRTATPKQTEISQHIFTSLHRNRLLEEQTALQPYCPEHNTFLADRFIEGTCPRCQYEDARGDQCDKCGNLLSALDLVNPRCKLDGAAPAPRETRHQYLRLDKLEERVANWFSASVKAGGWSKNGSRITETLLKEGLIPRPITRDLKWGTPVPLPGYESKVLYVWFDACIGYISITASHTPDWELWWRSPDEVKLYQFMGKDNVPFHSIVFPSTLIGTGETWTKCHYLDATDYLNYEDGKFSKSRGIGVFGNDAAATGLSASVWRYYLLSTRPETGDTRFDWTSFMFKNNSELLSNLGNLANRLIKFTIKHFNGRVPDYPPEINNESFSSLSQDVNQLLAKYLDSMEAVRLRSGLEIAMGISTRGNQYLTENAFGSALVADDFDRAASVVAHGLNLVYLLSALIYPYMPSTAADITAQLNAPLRAIPEQWNGQDLLPGHQIGEPRHLFRKIDKKQIEEWRQRFGGTAELSDNNSIPGNANSAKVRQQQKEPKGGPGEAMRSFLPGMIDLRVGKILRAVEHPNADSLYVSTIDCGDLPGTANTAWDEEYGTTVRTVCSGLNGKIPLVDLQGRPVVVVANLKPVNMRGVRSAAMLLAAEPRDSRDGGSCIELVEPPTDARTGERLYFEGWESCTPDPVLKPKEKLWDILQVALSTNSKREVVILSDKIIANVAPSSFNGVSGSSDSRLVSNNGLSCSVTSLDHAIVR
ncbi:methionyl-tRNA synthetase [Fusarium proliferatum]|nr:methionyl-tRNA synthetase [Fusarium proliferatum]